MPLVVFCGIPASGKTTHARKLLEVLRAAGRAVVLINEEAFGIDKASAYASSEAEKDMRSQLKSAVERELTAEKVVILDSTNYIKGFRYELFCFARTARTPQVTVFVDTPRELASSWNQTLSSELFTDLAGRLEVPNPKNRWDKPMFHLRPGEELQYDAVCEALSGEAKMRKAVSTKTEEAVGENYLYSVDNATSSLIEVLLTAQDQGREELDFEGERISLTPPYSVLELKKARQQFLKLTRMHPCPSSEVGRAFLGYIGTIRTDF
jgi:protein KTI12